MRCSSSIVESRCRLPMTVLLPLLWVTYEFVRHEMAELITGTGFPWLKLGTALVENRTLVQVADLGGEYLLTFLVALISGPLVDLLLALSPNRTTKFWPILVSCLVMIASTGYGHWRINQSSGVAGPTVVLMGELDLPPLLPPARLKETTGDRHADLLLWPELAYHHRSGQVHNRGNTCKTGSEVGGDFGGDIIDTEMDFWGLMRHIGRNFKTFFSAAPNKFFRELY